MKILFVGNDASVTGAPILFLELIQEFKKKGIGEYKIVLLHDGPLLPEFKKTGKTYVVNKIINSRINLFQKIIKTFNVNRFLKILRILSIRSMIRRNNFDIFYLNSVPTLLFFEWFKTNDKKIICHVHELEISIQQFCGKYIFQKHIHRVGYFFTASKAVATNLVINHNIPEKQINTIYEYINLDKLSKYTNSNDPEIRKSLGVDQDTYLICGSGTMDWRKGFDLLSYIIHEYKKITSHTNFLFIWLGGYLEGIAFKKVEYDLKKLDVHTNIKFLGVQNNPYQFYKSCNVFILPSREDPFPLVCLEAAYYKKPVICFHDAGGMPEFIGNKNGMCVEYGNIVKFAEAIRILEDKSLIEKLGENASKEVKVKFNVANTADKIYLSLRELLNDF